MILAGLTNALKGIHGEFEVNRVVGAFGAAAYVVCGNAFVAYDVIWKARPFNITEYCLAFPGGLAVAVGAIAGAVAIKDRNVAVAQTVRDTGSMPGKGQESVDQSDKPLGTDADPLKAEIINTPENPANVQEAKP